MAATAAPTPTLTLRERQAPLKTRYETDPARAKLTLTVRSATEGDDPTRSRIATAAGPSAANGDAATDAAARPLAADGTAAADVAAGPTADPVAWDVGAHPMAAGDGELACSGDLLLASLAACQEITLRMVANAMGIPLRQVEVTVEGDMDFRGTMGVDPETPVGLTAIRTAIRVVADAPPDRLERLAQRAERYCVVAATLREPPQMTTTITTDPPPPDRARLSPCPPSSQRSSLPDS